MIENDVKNEEPAGESPGGMTREDEAAAFERFLASLAPDRDQAAVRYENLRRAVIKFCITRRAPDPETCADEVLRVLQRRVAAGRTIRHVESLAIGVARFVLLRDWQRRRREAELPQSGSEVKNPGATPLEILEKQVETDRLSRCLAECWQTFSDEDRKLMERYGLGSEHDKDRRESLAAELGIDPGNLRVSIFRLKKKFRKCLDDCLKKISRKV